MKTIYVPMLHWHYDNTEPAEDPSRGYTSQQDALVIAQYGASGKSDCSGIVLSVEIHD